MEEVRSLLDELMGQDRNRDRPPRSVSFTDPQICKNFLVGFCPSEEFARTKHDVGPCTLEHDEGLKAAYQALDARERARLGFDRQLMTQWLERLMTEVQTKIRRNEERLVADAAAPALPPEDQAKLQDLTDAIQEQLTRSEVLGEQGDVDGAQAAAAQADTLKGMKALAEQEAAARGGMSRYGQQEVCPLSGVIVNKEESRLRDHQQGRNYRAWCHFHDVHKAVKEFLEKEGGRTRDRRDRESGSGRGRSPDRQKSSRDRDGERSAHRSEKRRDRARDRERERERSTHKDRSRRRERDRA